MTPVPRRSYAWLVVVTALAVASSAAHASEIQTGTAVLRWLDKVTARVSTIEAVVGGTTKIGTLEVIVRTCVTSPPEEAPESAAFLDISEFKPGEPAAEVFRGWMFASTPDLSALEHPVYDVWLIECRNNVVTGTPPSPASNTAH
ncbi:MAG: DUF2155 domain-containing protein [Alphaproteobacteria bacterium]|nr:DUF2155 domain-containing protein [Alphaproteobacteria bacterium]